MGYTQQPQPDWRHKEMREFLFKMVTTMYIQGGKEAVDFDVAANMVKETFKRFPDDSPASGMRTIATHSSADPVK